MIKMAKLELPDLLPTAIGRQLCQFPANDGKMTKLLRILNPLLNLWAAMHAVCEHT